MKENIKGLNKKIIIIFIILILMVTIIIVYLKVFKKTNDNKKLESNLVIVAKNRYNDYEYKDIFNDYLFVVKGNKLGIINKDGKVVVDFIYNKDANILINQNAFIINDKDKYDLYDKDIKLIVSLNDNVNIVNDISNNEIYYNYNNNLYNINQEIVYKDIDGYFIKAGNYLVTDTNIINMKNNNKISIKYFEYLDNSLSILSSDEKKLYIYDLKAKDLKEYDIEKIYTNGYSIKDKNNNKYSYNSNYGLVSSTKEINVLNYKFSFKDCSFGFKVYNNNNKLVNNECYENYSIASGNKVIYLNKDDKNYLLYDNKIVLNSNDVFASGNYLINYDQETSLIGLSSLDGKEIKNDDCYFSFEYFNEDKYYCSNGVNNYLVDEKLNKKTDKYEEIICIPNSLYCIFRKNKKYGLLEGNKELIPAIYDNMTTNNEHNKIIAESLFNFDVYDLQANSNYLEYFDNDLYKPYNDIDVSEIIKKYNLDNMKDLINDNEEIFKKYAYIVLNNQNLGNYQNKVLDLFYEVILNKEYLEENYFLESLRNLSIIKTDHLEEDGYVGFYYDDGKRIEFLDDEDNVVYHELTHFIDFSFNSNNSNNIFKCNNKYISNNEFNKLNAKEVSNCELVITDEPNFITEGGAEYYSSYYLNNKALRTYRLQTSIIGALSYLFGFDILNEIYFSSDGSYKLFKIFDYAGISIDDYLKFLQVTHRSWTLTNKDVFFVTDILIKIYENNKKMLWYEDKEFSEIISIIIGFSPIKEEYTERYLEYQKLNYDFPKKYLDLYQIDNTYLANVIGNYLYTDDGSYLIFNFFNEDYTDNYYKVVKIDFKNSKVIESKDY